MFTIRRHSQKSIANSVACAIVLASLASGVPSPSVAAEKIDAAVSVADRQAIEKVIRDQLDAFGRDDARRAFAHATPDIRRMFRTPDNFMRMVHDNYEPVYRAGSVRFVRLDPVEGQWVQTVQLVDEAGRVWRALFTMKRQPDKTWKVGGCQLLSTNAMTT